MLAILDENLPAQKICGVNEIGLFAPLSNEKITSNWYNGLLFPCRERKRRTERRAAHPTLVQISPAVCLYLAFAMLRKKLTAVRKLKEDWTCQRSLRLFGFKKTDLYSFFSTFCQIYTYTDKKNFFDIFCWINSFNYGRNKFNWWFWMRLEMIFRGWRGTLEIESIFKLFIIYLKSVY